MVGVFFNYSDNFCFASFFVFLSLFNTCLQGVELGQLNLFDRQLGLHSILLFLLESLDEINFELIQQREPAAHLVSIEVLFVIASHISVI